MAAPTAQEARALHDLGLLVVAKDLFLSSWYRDASARLFSEKERALFDRVRHESAVERDATLPVIERWTLDAAGEEVAKQGARIARMTRRDFLLTLIEAKEAAGEAYERAAELAPRHLRGEILRLAGIDFRHALELRLRLVKDYEESTGVASDVASP